MARLMQFSERFKSARKQLEVFSDFEEYVSGDLFTLVATNSGTATNTDGAGGLLSLTPSDGSVTDNDEIYLRTTKEMFLFANDKPIYFEVRIQYTEGATDDLNVCVGLMNAVAADSILDDGGGPKASYSGAVVFKVDGGTVWNCESSLAGTQTTTASTTTAGGSAYQTIGIHFQPTTSTTGEVTFTIDGAPFLDSNGDVIKHTITYTSATEMHAFVGMKNGADTTVETLVLDYLYAAQVR